jgi:aminomethyltransferase
VSPGTDPLQTPLHERHVEAGAQMVEFSGWSMPLQFTSMRDEHLAVRGAVGVFDVSHMGEFRMTGPSALSALEKIVTNEVASLEPGQARYNLVCDMSGGIVDDCLVYRVDGEDFMVVVNAGQRLEDLQHFRALAGASCEVIDHTIATALVAVQGPEAPALLAPHASIDLDAIGYYHFAPGELDGIPVTFSRTGYTGEDGYEIFADADDAAKVWDMAVDAGARPCGLGARDTLRLEAGMRLCGQDIGRGTNPLEAGLGWAVKLDKGDFSGRDALQKVKADGPARAFVGLLPAGRAIARHGAAIRDQGEVVGEVTSGTFGFTLGRALATGYVATPSKASDALEVIVRNEAVAAQRVPLPFYRRQRA